MNNTNFKIQTGIAKAGGKMKIAVFLAVFAFSSLGLANNCFGYVTPDWEAQIRANERQKPHTKPVKVNIKKEKKDNKKQKMHTKRVKVNKAALKKRNERQEFEGKPYKYDRQAELRRNALQKVN